MSCVSEVFDSHCLTNVELVPKAGSVCIVMFCVGAVLGKRVLSFSGA